MLAAGRAGGVAGAGRGREGWRDRHGDGGCGGDGGGGSMEAAGAAAGEAATVMGVRVVLAQGPAPRA